MYWYSTSIETRTDCGLAGRQFCLDNGLTSAAMGAKMIECIDTLFDTKPNVAQRYTVNLVTNTNYANIGIEI
jgi:hypothetical protein